MAAMTSSPGSGRRSARASSNSAVAPAGGGAVAWARTPGRRPAAARGGAVARLAGDVDHRGPLDERGQCGVHGVVEAAHGLRAAEDEDDPLARLAAHPPPGGRA